MNIVYGGSFNPVTIAHQSIASYLKSKFKPDNVIILPVGQKNYDKPGLISDEHRLNMLRIAFKEDVISTIEFNNSDFSGTLETLNILSKDYDDIYFVVGADNILSMKTWINYEEFLSNYKILVMTRNNIDILEVIDKDFSMYKDRFMVVNFNMNINSTLIRDNIEDSKEKLNAAVYKYIIKNNLYRK